MTAWFEDADDWFWDVDGFYEWDDEDDAEAYPFTDRDGASEERS